MGNTSSASRKNCGSKNTGVAKPCRAHAPRCPAAFRSKAGVSCLRTTPTLMSDRPATCSPVVALP
ncbi:MAG: hypothetical protein H6Q85_3183 [candidate division NC10 bacterium]|nr:hypothetical protein [candidate division NC10 bacterium]